jgi:hypothetical protein
MQSVHAFLRAVTQQFRQRRQRALECRIDQRLLRSTGTRQHIIYDFITVSWPAHTEPQAPEFGAQVLDDVAQAIVATVPTTLL